MNQPLNSTLDSTMTTRKPERACTAGEGAPSGAALPPYSPRPEPKQNLSDYSTVVFPLKGRGVESVESAATCQGNPAVRVRVLAGTVKGDRP